MKRRTFLVATAATVATAAGAGAVSGSPNTEFNSDSDLSPIPAAEGTVEIDEVAVGGDPLAFTEDDGASSSLSDYGAVVATEEADEDGDPIANNPFELRADRIDADELSDFPRGETNADDEPISALDADYWSEVDAEAAISQGSPASGGPGLDFVADGVADGAEAAVEFSHVDITSGTLRKELQAIVSIESVDGTVELRFGDGTDWAVATIDPAGNSDDVGTIATATETGVVYQSGVGELVDDLDAISTIQIAAVDGDASLEISALNVDRESKWSFGNREVVETNDDGDEELSTEEWVEPVGSYEVSSLGTLDDVFSGAEVTPLIVDVEHYPTVNDYSVGEPSNPAYDERLETVQSIEIPSAYDISYQSLEVSMEIGLSPDQWTELEVSTGLDEPLELGDRDDETFTDYHADLDTLEVGDSVGLGDATSGEVVAVSQAIDVTESQLEEIEDEAVVGFFAGGGSGGFLSTPAGVASTVAAGVVSYLAIARGWLASLLGGT